MEAYAAVTSLLNLLEHVQFYHARRPYFLDEQQSQLTYLGKQVSSLQSYLEAYHNGDGQDAQCLEIRIADKSYEAEDIIESHIVGDKFLENNEFIGSVNNFSQRLEKLVAEMDCIAKEAMGIKEKSTLKDQKHRFSSPVVSSSRAPLGIDSMVGFHDEMKCIIDKLIRQTVRKIISITGMGGIGKTTLAKNVYDNPAVVQRFDVRCWVTISQGYDVREMLLCIVRDMKASDEGDRLLKCHEIGLKVHKYLSQRRYLIVLDDVWSIEAWEEIQLYLPDDNNGSRILVTSRLLGVANNFDASNHFEMKFLGENESWNLLCKKVFIQESCPPELEEIGKRIARYCKGLPLTIVVIGGLLAKSKMILRHWKDILEDTSKIAMSGDDDNCSRILSLSYNHLPIYLKPCFIYMGVFPEDHSIRVSKIIKLWVAEGFLKSIYGKSLEEVAHDCLKDLIDRNLIFVDKFGLTGKMKVCKIHDLLRDLCLREARKCRFFCLLKEQSKDISQELSYMRRVAFNGRQKNSLHELGHALQSASSLRTYLDHFCEYIHGGAMLTLCYFKLLRVLDDEDDMYDLQDIIQFVNARYVNTWSLFNTKSLSAGDIVHHRNFFWNVQTLILNYSAWNWEGLFVIWEMPQLRHLTIAKFCLPDPPSRVDGQDIVVLENLQTLAVVRNFRSTEEILERVPNIKILKIIIGGGNNDDDAKLSLQSLGNLCRLRKLQSLNCQFSTSSCIDLSDIFRHNVKFPLSLKKVNLQWCLIEWDDMGALIGGGIPQLEHLKLYGCCTGSEQWNPVEGQFDSLKVLEILRTGPVQWNADCVHFPCLEHLVLSCVDELKEIPPGIGEIETLQSICVVKGDTSLVDSAKEILEEQRKLGNEDFTLQIINMFPEDRTIKYKSDLAITNKKKRNVDGPTQYDSSSVDSFFRNYKLGKTLGIGSFGKVKIAEHILTGHKVTVKILNRRRIKNRDMEEQVRKEIKILRLLMHPHIEHLYEVVEMQSDIYIVMEYAKYGELFDYIVEKGRLHDEEARTFFQQIISAVEYCHMNMVVHRDLKPENLLLDSKCNVKISDFGLSNMMRDGHFLKTICGSPNYAAPEVIKGKLYAGPEVDVWSCGVVLYALLCGYLPFDDENMPNLFKKIKGGIYTIPSHLSAGARDLISRMLVVDPMKRTCIPEIRSHPWFQANLPNYLAVPPLDTTQQAKTIDEDILQEVIKMGFERNALVDSLRNRVQNEGTITYYLLLDNRF